MSGKYVSINLFLGIMTYFRFIFLTYAARHLLARNSATGLARKVLVGISATVITMSLQWTGKHRPFSEPLERL